MNKVRAIIEAAVFSIVMFVMLFVVLEMKLLFAIIGAIIMFPIILGRQYFKYRLKKEREEEYR